MDGLYRARRRKVHGFCQPDRPATEQVARGSRPGQLNGIHHTASVFGVPDEEDTIRAVALRGIRAIRVGCAKDTCGIHVKHILLYVSKGEMGGPAPKRAARASVRDQGNSGYGPRAGAGRPGRHAGNTQAGPWSARKACASLPSIESKRIRRRARREGGQPVRHSGTTRNGCSQ